MSSKLSIEEMLAHLEKREKHHREQETFHAEQEVFHEQQQVHHREQRAVHAAELDGVAAVINDFLKEKFGIIVAFDVHDALARLRAQGLVGDLPSGEIRAMPLRDASRHLHERWCSALDQS